MFRGWVGADVGMYICGCYMVVSVPSVGTCTKDVGFSNTKWHPLFMLRYLTFNVLHTNQY